MKSRVVFIMCTAIRLLRFGNDEIKQKSDLIKNLKLGPQEEGKLIALLLDCSSRKSHYSNNNAVKLCKEFPLLFENTDKITSEMQINTLKLVNELAKKINLKGSRSSLQTADKPR